jgi:lipid-A-disaccharide synthase
VVADVSALIQEWPVPAIVLSDPREKAAAIAAADVALAASGTVAVELAVAGVAAVIAYRVSPLTAFVARRVIKLPYASLPNILLGREVQPEFIQENCTPDNLAPALIHLLQDPKARAAQIAAAGEAVAMLRPEGALPSIRAARTILRLVQAGNQRAKGLPIENTPKEAR